VTLPRKTLAAIVAIVIIVIAASVITMLRRGLSARGEPTFTEAVIARSMRRFATPSAMRNAKNPIALTDATLREAREHWADHCATCHGNNGSGQTDIGRNLYPKAPDMRQAATQQMSDGELFSIIRNGVRLTGMPAWGGDDAENWKLVHFVRHLAKLTPEELAEMEKQNPKTPAEWQQMKDEAAFLAGKGPR
jgi:mono/diheme cytochrome c family protein